VPRSPRVGDIQRDRILLAFDQTTSASGALVRNGNNSKRFEGFCLGAKALTALHVPHSLGSSPPAGDVHAGENEAARWQSVSCVETDSGLQRQRLGLQLAFEKQRVGS